MDRLANDYAQRVEMLGIGRIGNKKCKPQWEAEELSQVLLGVAFGKESDGYEKEGNAPGVYLP